MWTDAMRYSGMMSIKSSLRAIWRKLLPPGNRGSDEDSNRQPSGEGTHIGSEAGRGPAGGPAA
jgi:hypothetical protein